MRDKRNTTQVSMYVEFNYSCMKILLQDVQLKNYLLCLDYFREVNINQPVSMDQ